MWPLCRSLEFSFYAVLTSSILYPLNSSCLGLLPTSLEFPFPCPQHRVTVRLHLGLPSFWHGLESLSNKLQRFFSSKQNLPHLFLINQASLSSLASLPDVQCFQNHCFTNFLQYFVVISSEKINLVWCSILSLFPSWVCKIMLDKQMKAPSNFWLLPGPRVGFVTEEVPHPPYIQERSIL